MNRNNGLYVAGTVMWRTRKTFGGKDGRSFQVAYYTIVDDFGNRYYVEQFDPQAYFDLNTYAEIAVYVKPFQKKSGSLSYTLNIRKEIQTRGDPF